MIDSLPQLTDSQFRQFSELVYKQTGIYLKPEKKQLLNARLGKRLRACSIDSFKRYYEFVCNDESGGELISLINSVSTNFTSFFREQAHFDYMVSTVLPAFSALKNSSRTKLNIWSAACSSGEEPYTISMTLEEYMAENKGAIDYKIIATDISTRVLGQAERGVYSEDRVSKVPPMLLQKYFRRGVRNASGYFKVKDSLGRNLLFQRINLMDEFLWQEPMDIIFCRNVMIYFNIETQQELVDKFYRCLADGGYLFIGHSESIARLSHKFSQVAATVYRK